MKINIFDDLTCTTT